MCEIQRNGVDNLTCKAEIETQMYTANVWMLKGGHREWDELGGWDYYIHTLKLLYENRYSWYLII